MATSKLTQVTNTKKINICFYVINCALLLQFPFPASMNQSDKNAMNFEYFSLFRGVSDRYSMCSATQNSMVKCILTALQNENMTSYDLHL